MMKNIVIIGITALCLLVPMAYTEETSTRRLSQLVTSVDNRLSKLEDQTTVHRSVIKSHNARLKKAKADYLSATNSLDRHAAKSVVIEELTGKNTNLVAQVNCSMNTFSAVISDFYALRDEVDKGGFSEKKLRERRLRIATELNKIGPALKAIEDIVGTKQHAQMLMTRKTLILLYKQLSAQEITGKGLNEKLESTTEQLNEVVAQLTIVRDLLQHQRFVISLAAHAEMIWLAINRLQSAQLDSRNLKELADSLVDDIMNDTEEYYGILMDFDFDNDTGDTDVDGDVMAIIEAGSVPTTPQL